MKKLIMILCLSASAFVTTEASRIPIGAPDFAFGEQPPRMGTVRSAFTPTAVFPEVRRTQLEKEARILLVFRANHVVANADVFARMLNMTEHDIRWVIDQFCIAGNLEKTASKNENRPYNIFAVQDKLYARVGVCPALYGLLIDMLTVLNLHKNPNTSITPAVYSQVILLDMIERVRTTERADTTYLAWENARTMFSEFLRRSFSLDCDVGPYEDEGRVGTPSSAGSAAALYNSSHYPVWNRPGSTGNVSPTTPDE